LWKFTCGKKYSLSIGKHSPPWGIFILFMKKFYLFGKNILFQAETFSNLINIYLIHEENLTLWEKYSLAIRKVLPVGYFILIH
jgi:hypothetical protein